jgi:hypothetical protein
MQLSFITPSFRRGAFVGDDCWFLRAMTGVGWPPACSRVGMGLNVSVDTFDSCRPCFRFAILPATMAAAVVETGASRSVRTAVEQQEKTPSKVAFLGAF